jgi:serine/threonine protein phosphatase PrpC
MNITTASAKGQRPYQEDTSINVELPQGRLLGVFDGHGGNEASQFMAENFAGVFEETGSFRLAFRIAAQHLKDYEAGTTASVVLIPKDSRTVFTAVIGDSPIIIQTDSGIWYSPDHNVRTNEIERVAAQNRGGYYCGGYIMKGISGPGLQMGRALGDALLAPVLSTVPEVAEITVAPKGFVLIGTDGLFDPGHYGFKDAAKQVIARVNQDDAQALVDRAVQLPTGDNVTAILVKF